MRKYSGKNGVKGDDSPTPYFSIFYVAMQLFAIRLPQTICNVVDIKYSQDRRNTYKHIIHPLIPQKIKNEARTLEHDLI
mgnify:CR=1 FL=1